MTIEQKFWQRVEPMMDDRGCWEWTGATYQGKQYGQFAPRRGLNCRAHRFSWEMAFGQIPDGLCVCHRCDNPSCVNPAHLWLGTHAENIADRDMKARHVPLRGERNGSSKLTRGDVLNIRQSPESAGRLARKFGVHKNHIYRLRRREQWIGGY